MNKMFHFLPKTYLFIAKYVLGEKKEKANCKLVLD